MFVLGGLRHDNRRGTGCIQTGAPVGAQNLWGDKKVSKGETFNLVDQMRRAASSVGMNLMEGAMRLGSREYRQFVGIARGSAGEVCYQLILARDLQYVSIKTYEELRLGYDRVIQMLSRLSHSRNH